MLLLLPPRLAAQQESSQGPIPVRYAVNVTANLAARVFEASLPFQEPFRIKVKWPDTMVEEIILRYGIGATDREPGQCSFRDRPNTAVFRRQYLFGNADAYLRIVPLLANREYLFQFAIKRQTGTESVCMVGSTASSWGSHFDQDLGLVVSDRASYWGVSTAIHFHVRPINKNFDLRGLSVREQMLHRTSIFVGLALVELTADANVKKYYSTGSPVVGIAIRPLTFFRPLRVGTGIMWFKQEDANPLVSADKRKIDRFAMVTVDFDIRSIFGPLLAVAGVK